MQKYLILIFALVFFQNLIAQEELDSNVQKEDPRLKDLIWVKDTTYEIFKSRRFSNLKVLYPSFRTYCKFIDSSAAGDQSHVTQYAMYNNFWNRLRLQFTKMYKKSNKAGIDWAKTSLDSFYIDSGKAGSNEYAYVNWVIQHNKKRRYHISALFLNMKGKWFIVDELKFNGLIVEKKKKKPSKKK